MSETTFWKLVTDRTYRLEVPGGWLYRYAPSQKSDTPVALCFVPFPPAAPVVPGPGYDNPGKER
jgi:hypothetical protein